MTFTPLKMKTDAVQEIIERIERGDEVPQKLIEILKEVRRDYIERWQDVYGRKWEFDDKDE